MAGPELQAPPEALLNALEGRYRQLVAGASGSVLELPGSGVMAVLVAEAQAGSQFDSILSFMRTPQVVDLAGLVSAMERVLADDGWIEMIEPQRSGDSDIVTALRSGGFFVSDLHRLRVASVPRPWKHYIELRARRETPAV